MPERLRCWSHSVIFRPLSLSLSLSHSVPQIFSFGAIADGQKIYIHLLNKQSHELTVETNSSRCVWVRVCFQASPHQWNTRFCMFRTSQTAGGFSSDEKDQINFLFLVALSHGKAIETLRLPRAHYDWFFVECGFTDQTVTSTGVSSLFLHTLWERYASTPSPSTCGSALAGLINQRTSFVSAASSSSLLLKRRKSSVVTMAAADAISDAHQAGGVEAGEPASGGELVKTGRAPFSTTTATTATSSPRDDEGDGSVDENAFQQIIEAVCIRLFEQSKLMAAPPPPAASMNTAASSSKSLILINEGSRRKSEVTLCLPSARTKPSDMCTSSRALAAAWEAHFQPHVERSIVTPTMTVSLDQHNSCWSRTTYEVIRGVVLSALKEIRGAFTSHASDGAFMSFDQFLGVLSTYHILPQVDPALLLPVFSEANCQDTRGLSDGIIEEELELDEFLHVFVMVAIAAFADEDKHPKLVTVQSKVHELVAVFLREYNALHGTNARVSDVTFPPSDEDWAPLVAAVEPWRISMDEEEGIFVAGINFPSAIEDGSKGGKKSSAATDDNVTAADLVKVIRQHGHQSRHRAAANARRKASASLDGSVTSASSSSRGTAAPGGLLERSSLATEGAAPSSLSPEAATAQCRRTLLIHAQSLFDSGEVSSERRLENAKRRERLLVYLGDVPVTSTVISRNRVKAVPPRAAFLGKPFVPYCAVDLQGLKAAREITIAVRRVLLVGVTVRIEGKAATDPATPAPPPSHPQPGTAGAGGRRNSHFGSLLSGKRGEPVKPLECPLVLECGTTLARLGPEDVSCLIRMFMGYAVPLANAKNQRSDATPTNEIEVRHATPRGQASSTISDAQLHVSVTTAENHVLTRAGFVALVAGPLKEHLPVNTRRPSFAVARDQRHFLPTCSVADLFDEFCGCRDITVDVAQPSSMATLPAATPIVTVDSLVNTPLKPASPLQLDASALIATPPPPARRGSTSNGATPMRQISRRASDANIGGLQVAGPVSPPPQALPRIAVTRVPWLPEDASLLGGVEVMSFSCFVYAMVSCFFESALASDDMDAGVIVRNLSASLHASMDRAGLRTVLQNHTYTMAARGGGVAWDENHQLPAQVEASFQRARHHHPPSQQRKVVVAADEAASARKRVEAAQLRRQPKPPAPPLPVLQSTLSSVSPPSITTKSKLRRKTMRRSVAASDAGGGRPVSSASSGVGSTRLSSAAASFEVPEADDSQLPPSRIPNIFLRPPAVVECDAGQEPYQVGESEGLDDEPFHDHLVEPDDSVGPAEARTSASTTPSQSVTAAHTAPSTATAAVLFGSLWASPAMIGSMPIASDPLVACDAAAMTDDDAEDKDDNDDDPAALQRDPSSGLSPAARLFPPAAAVSSRGLTATQDPTAPASSITTTPTATTTPRRAPDATPMRVAAMGMATPNAGTTPRPPPARLPVSTPLLASHPQRLPLPAIPAVVPGREALLHAIDGLAGSVKVEHLHSSMTMRGALLPVSLGV